MFARAARVAGTAAYEDYYARRPDLREGDDRVRRLPALFVRGGRHFDEALSSEAAALFDSIPRLEPEAAVVEAFAARLGAAEDPSHALVAMALELGAVAAGTAEVDEAFVYSAKGRRDTDYGEPPAEGLPRALLFLVEMDHDAMRAAPRAPVLRESARQYLAAARISLTLAAALRAAGHRAASQHDARYDLVLPPLAVRAGLGELGRNNILVADRFGARVRIGAVSTDAPLSAGEPRSLGVRAFCEICRKCAECCPSGALDRGEPRAVRGVVKWRTDEARCYAHWRRIGTDCGICMAVCPFSHRASWPHALVRRLVRLGPLFARAALAGDDLLYGRRWRPRRG